MDHNDRLCTQCINHFRSWGRIVLLIFSMAHGSVSAVDSNSKEHTIVFLPAESETNASRHTEAGCPAEFSVGQWSHMSYCEILTMQSAPVFAMEVVSGTDDKSQQFRILEAYNSPQPGPQPGDLLNSHSPIRFPKDSVVWLAGRISPRDGKVLVMVLVSYPKDSAFADYAEELRAQSVHTMPFEDRLRWLLPKCLDEQPLIAMDALREVSALPMEAWKNVPEAETLRVWIRRYLAGQEKPSAALARFLKGNETTLLVLLAAIGHPEDRSLMEQRIFGESSTQDTPDNFGIIFAWMMMSGEPGFTRLREYYLPPDESDAAALRITDRSAFLHVLSSLWKDPPAFLSQRQIDDVFIDTLHRPSFTIDMDWVIDDLRRHKQWQIRDDVLKLFGRSPGIDRGCTRFVTDYLVATNNMPEDPQRMAAWNWLKELYITRPSALDVINGVDDIQPAIRSPK